MHLTGKNSRFVAPFWPRLWPSRRGRRHLRFIGKRHTIQLQETALVIEGEILRLSFPLFDWLFQRALCEWTTITVPYTRIDHFRYHRRWVLRGLLIAFLVGLVLFGIAAVKGNPGHDTVIIILFTVGLGLAVLWALIRVPTYFSVRCRRRDGKEDRFGLTVWPRALRREFAEALEGHRRQAAQFARRPGPPAGEPVTLTEVSHDPH
jgi:hypothetical protein